MNNKAPSTYSASIARLRELVDRLESAQVDVDELENLMRESVELVTVCRSRLRSTQFSVDTLLSGLHEDGKHAQSASVAVEEGEA
jgi:exodeoxyribonuclease VII small subunit